MTTESTIDKFAVLPDSQDYNLLRKLGISHIEKLAARLWTDYNIHDPGITTLELLCYAITDLGYRTAYPVEDLLAEKTVGQLDDEHRFYTARQIMPCNSVTADDYRALLIDVPGVKNAWLEIVEQPEPQLFVECSCGQLTVDPNFHVTADALNRLGGQNIPQKILTALETLIDKDVTYTSREAFLDDLTEAIGEEEIAPYLSVLIIACAYAGEGRKIEPVFIQGLYDIILELETEPEFGNLNRFQEPFLFIAEDETSYQAEIVLPVWDAFFSRSLDPSEIEQLVFGRLTYDSTISAYRGSLQVQFETGDVLDDTYRVVFEGPKTASNQERIEEALEANATVKESYRSKMIRAIQIAGQACEILHAHRSLCEDIRYIKSISIDDIYLCVDIEVSPEADLERVLAEVYYRIDQFLSPAVNFYSIAELLDKGYSTDQIFEGPILEHGFIDPQELHQSTLRTEVRSSDLVQILMDIEDVRAVKNLLMTDAVDGVIKNQNQSWCLPVLANHAVRLDIERSKIVFYKGIVPYHTDQQEVLREMADLQALSRSKRLAKKDYDLDIPAGQNRQVQRYRSIQKDFPLCYGIGHEGLSHSADARRKAQAKQFKAYLLFYDQMLANYFAQLAHLKDLFSIHPQIKKTYFSQSLCQTAEEFGVDVPNVAALSKAFVDWLDPVGNPQVDIDNAATYTKKWSTVLRKLSDRFIRTANQREELLEDQETYEARRNRILDHLMARFCESFSEYVPLMYRLDRKKAPLELIADKLDFLADYPIISRDLGKAFNYRDRKHLWFSDNVSGLKKRVSRLLGIRSYRRRFLSDCIEQAFEIYQEQDVDLIDEYRFRLQDDQGNILLSSSKHFHHPADAQRTIRQVIRYGSDRRNYRCVTAVDGRFYFNLLDSDDKIVARRIQGFETETEREAGIDEVIEFITTKADCEGFHLIEHLLLRPELIDQKLPDRDSLMSVCVDQDCNNCSGYVDPYSFRVTAVVPAWPERFRNIDFRRFFEKTLREQAPAHVHVKICWIEQENMQLFEVAYEQWLQVKADPFANPYELRAAQHQLVYELSTLRSVYDEVRLNECVAGDEQRPLLLNHSVLGSMKKEQ